MSQIFRSRVFLRFLIIPLLFLQGCVLATTYEKNDGGEQGHHKKETEFIKIFPGVTKKADIREILGSPTRKERYKDGSESWTYSSVHQVLKPGFGITDYTSVFSKNTPDMTSRPVSLTVTLNRKGVILNSRVRPIF